MVTAQSFFKELKSFGIHGNFHEEVFLLIRHVVSLQNFSDSL